ncbi:vacuole membrane protein 1-like [Hibiscus syriacus]|uniref:Vacuole membrane protein 1-like n=1 Tax=Hibiscus syriacus TaxID=106335 RepID=A0A6A2WVC5_HIBSY|nr:vacuole membrane protein 1-like [Hibiscus syriacus]
MDRTREARRAAVAASASTTQGLSRRRHRSSSIRDSPEDDGPVELQETTRLRDRKKDRDRERERDRERDRERERERERERDLLSRAKGGGTTAGGGSARMIPPNNVAGSLSIHHQQQHQHRKSFPVPVKVIRTTPPSGPSVTTTTTTSSTWKAADEMIGVSVPRKARSASTKRSHEWASGGGGAVGVVGGEHIHRQASTSPVRTGVAGMLTSPSPAPASPSSSNVSARKKIKPNGAKQRPPKLSSKSSSSAQEEIEMEIAEVLYGLMRQPQVPLKQDINGNDSREVNKLSNDSKSRVSSPISNSTSTIRQPSSILPSNSYSSATPISAIAPKRKRPRPVKYEDEIAPIAPSPSVFPIMNNSVSSTTTKVEIDQPAKIEATSPYFEKNSLSMAENLMNSSQVVPASSELNQAEPMKDVKSSLVPDSKPLTEESESRDLGICKKEGSQYLLKGTSSPANNNPSSTGLRLDDERDNVTVKKANSTVYEIESQREEKFQIDLMALPSSRSSPERDDEIDFGASDPKPMTRDMELEMKSTVKEDDKRVKVGKADTSIEAVDCKKPKLIAEEAESTNPVLNNESNINLQLDLKKLNRDSATGSVCANKFNHHAQKLQHQQPDIEKSAQSGVPLPMSLASWPGGLPPMGYMAPLQGVVSMDGSAVSSASIQACYYILYPPHLLFNQPRPKRCATHCYIARNVHYHQQFMKMNTFWPAAPGSASLYGPKTNLNIVPPSEMNGNIPGRAVNSVQDKGQSLAIFPGHVGKDKSLQAATNTVDAAQRKQILLQPALPPGAPSNILHGPAFIFPLSQQAAAAAAASVRPASAKSPGTSSTTLSTSNSASVSTTPAGATAAPAMSFNYANMPGNETQYLAILQNNAYPFPFPAHVGALPGYRGNHAQPMPFIPGSFYTSQMLHPAQIQQQQQQQQPLIQLQQSQQDHQNPSMSSGASSSLKHLQRPHGSVVGSGSGNLQVFPTPTNQSPHLPQLQQRQQQPSQHASHQARRFEGELGGKESPSTADSRVSGAKMNIYGQNFAMPLQHPSFTVMTSAPLGGSTSSGGNHGEKKQHTQQPGSKPGVERLTSQSFAMSFASINGTTTPGLDLQSLPESTRQGYQQIMAAAEAAQTAQQKKKNYHASEEGSHGTNDACSAEEGRNAIAGKISATAGQSIAFSRPDLPDSSVSTLPGNNVIDSSARTINLGSASSRTSGSVMPALISGVNSPNAQQQLQWNLQQQQQLLQLQKSHQFGTAAASQSKLPATSSVSAYYDHLSSSMAAKFPNALSAFPQNIAQTSSSPVQSSQWKNSARTTAAQVSPLSSSTSSTLKNISQQQARSQQCQSDISFVTNPKSTQSQQHPNSNPSPSPPMMVGSPTTSISRSAGGSPKTTGSTSTGSKGGQAPSLSSQQTKNSPSVPSQMSSPVGGRSVPSVLGNSHLSSSSNTGTKPQVVLQQQQHQKHAMQPAQLFFSNAYMQQAQAQHSPSTTAPSGYFLQRHRNEQQQAQPLGSSTNSTSMLSLCTTVTLANTTDPVKAAAAAGNMKGGGIAPQGLIHAAQFATTQSSGKPYQVVPGLPYVHAVSAAVQVKPAEQKQPAGE